MLCRPLFLLLYETVFQVIITPFLFELTPYILLPIYCFLLIELQVLYPHESETLYSPYKPRARWRKEMKQARSLDLMQASRSTHKFYLFLRAYSGKKKNITCFGKRRCEPYKKTSRMRLRRQMLLHANQNILSKIVSAINKQTYVFLQFYHRKQRNKVRSGMKGKYLFSKKITGMRFLKPVLLMMQMYPLNNATNHASLALYLTTRQMQCTAETKLFGPSRLGIGGACKAKQTLKTKHLLFHHTHNYSTTTKSTYLLYLHPDSKWQEKTHLETSPSPTEQHRCQVTHSVRPSRPNQILQVQSNACHQAIHQSYRIKYSRLHGLILRLILNIARKGISRKDQRKERSINYLVERQRQNYQNLKTLHLL